jgi:hypothetical protein
LGDARAHITQANECHLDGVLPSHRIVRHLIVQCEAPRHSKAQIN